MMILINGQPNPLWTTFSPVSVPPDVDNIVGFRVGGRDDGIGVGARDDGIGVGGRDDGIGVGSLLGIDV